MSRYGRMIYGVSISGFRNLSSRLILDRRNRRSILDKGPAASAVLPRRDSTGLFSGSSRARRAFDKARLTNPQAILQREVNSAARVDLRSAFTASVLGRLGQDSSPR
jgi:hypothetical protein